MNLMWAGQITNDTFFPLRSVGRKARPARRAERVKYAGGRWSLAESLQDPTSTETERAHARVTMFARTLRARQPHSSIVRRAPRRLPGDLSGVARDGRTGPSASRPFRGGTLRLAVRASRCCGAAAFGARQTREPRAGSRPPKRGPCLPRGRPRKPVRLYSSVAPASRRRPSTSPPRTRRLGSPI